MKSLFYRFTTWLASIAEDGGPSSTRVVFLSTGAVVSFGWLALIGSVVYRYVKFGTVDGATLAAIVTLAGMLFGFATGTQYKKLATDAAAKASSDAAVS